MYKLDMKINSVEKALVARKSSQFVSNNIPEFAFLGRSNVGKSSFLNHLLKNKRTAKVSQTPGKTRSVDFYKVNKKFFFVDLPGYGYAKLPTDVTNAWRELIESYLKNSESLKIAFVLVDIRHTPMEKDRMMVEWLRYYSHDFAIIATKSDKLTKNKIFANVKKIEKHFGVEGKNLVFPFSIKEGKCREKVWGFISSKMQ